MDLNSTSTISAQNSISNSTSQIQSGAKTEKTDNFFDKEMETQKNSETAQTEESEKGAEASKEDKNVIEDEENTKSDNKTKDQNDIVNSDFLEGAINYTDFKYHNESQSILSQNIQNLLNTKDLINTINSAYTVEYDVLNMSEGDANFFANLVQNTGMSMKDISSQVSESINKGTQNVTRNVNVTSVLMEKLSNSFKTNQPFRINFDNDISVIIKVNKDGSLSANFIPGDKAVEQYLRNNISFLRQRFDDENLAYKELSYSNHQERQQNQNRKKESDNE